MGDRELRDEIEVLYGRLKLERAKADAPQDAELAKARSALQAEVAELTGRKRALRERLVELETLLKDRKSETATARRELSAARAAIADREPLGNPLAESYSNWETPKAGGGCAMGVGLLAGVTLSALGWWLA